VRTFTHLLEIDPGNALAWENLGTAQLQGKDYKMVEFRPTHGPAFCYTAGEVP
jgi:hypothetical protein